MKKYRCIHCGEYFESAEYDKSADCGFFMPQPDCCDDCAQCINDSYIDAMEMISDADNGL